MDKNSPDIKAIIELVKAAFKKYGYQTYIAIPASGLKGLKGKRPSKKPFQVVCKVRHKHISRGFSLYIMFDATPNVVIKDIRNGTMGIIPIGDPKFKERVFATYLKVHGDGLLHDFMDLIKISGVRTRADRIEYFLSELELLVPTLHNRAVYLREQLKLDIRNEFRDMVHVAASFPPKAGR